MANRELVHGNFTLNRYTETQNEVIAREATIQSKRHELRGLINSRNDKAKELKSLTTRALSGFRGVYGPDAQQYDQAGGTRSSKRQARRPNAPKPEAAAAAATA